MNVTRSAPVSGFVLSLKGIHRQEKIKIKQCNTDNYVRKQLERGTGISIQTNTKASSWSPTILSLVDTPIRLSLRLNQATPDAYQ